MSARKKPADFYDKKFDMCWVSCSIETKQKIESFFTDTMHFNMEIFPIIINGNRPFSLYEFRRDSEHTSMLIITRNGIKRINELCRDLETDKEIRTILLKYFRFHLKENHDTELNEIIKIIPYLAYVYNRYKDREYFSQSENMTGRYLCVFYPLDKDLYKGLSIMLNQINLLKEDVVTKDRMYIV